MMTTQSIDVRRTDTSAPTEAKAVAKTRLYFVDNLRILLIILLILHHLAITYGASGLWYYNEAPSSDIATLVLTLFVGINQAFFLAFFFMISGYFTPGSYDRKSTGLFLKDRLLRLGIPLLFYAIFIDPLIQYAVAVNVRRFTGSFWDFIARYWGNYSGLQVGPLWFVETLLIFSVVYVLWRLVTPTPTVSQQIDGKVPSNLSIAGFALLLGVVTFAVRIWLPEDRWFELLSLPLAYYPQYIALFVVGIVAYRRNWFMGIFEATGKLWLGIAGLCIVLLPVLFVVGGALEGQTTPFLGGVHWQSFVFSVWQQFLCMGMIIGLLVWFRERFNHQGKLGKAMAASAYTVYIIHAPVIVFLGLALQDISLPSLLKFVLVAPVAVVLCFLIANYLRKLPLARNIL
jgi:glucan biosynthesis protein C